jgi:hypothetical protein
MFAFERATVSQVDTVLQQLDEASIKAIQLAGWEDYGAAVRLLQQHSKHCLVLLRSGEPLAVFGVLPGAGGEATAWLIAVEKLPRLPLRVFVTARRFLKAFLTEFNSLRTLVWENNTSHIRWVEWLGFKDTKEVSYGTHESPFHIYRLEN